MHYIDGESLRHRLGREGQLPLPDAISLLRQAAEAIGFAHRQGVVHRDLKPENLLLTRDGRLLVADFGVARTLDDDLGLTMTGMAVGTRAYMSPEQHGGGKAPDARTDVYALGCVLYECLAGEPPFTGNTASSIAAKHVHAPIPDVRIVRTTAPEALQQVLETALAKSPADRYPSAVELAEALAAVADRPDRPTPRRPSGGMTRKVAGGVVALGVVGALGALLLRPRGEAGAPPPANVPVLAVLPFREREPGTVPAPLLPRSPRTSSPSWAPPPPSGCSTPASPRAPPPAPSSATASAPPSWSTARPAAWATAWCSAWRSSTRRPAPTSTPSPSSAPAATPPAGARTWRPSWPTSSAERSAASGSSIRRCRTPEAASPRAT
ncbi:MAG: serine/threonine protein kinase [Gemmatimonadetes bacterium]|nr:serine/threonine protein kinase [Gemmatimonadota bacterium]